MLREPNGPHFEYLTNSYVRYLGLESFPVHARDVSVVWVTEESSYPMTWKGFDIAVVYNHALYIREPDGLAWSRKR